VPDVTSKHSFVVSHTRYAMSALVIAFTAVSAIASAQNVDEFGPIREDKGRNRPTEQNIAVELRFGAYLPELPNVLNTTPSFGDELGRNHRVLVGFEADWQALRIPKILSLGPGAGMGYTRLSKSGNYNGNAYSAALKVMPQWLEAVLRVDVLQQRWGIPIVFSGKFGAARASWWSSNRPPNSTGELSDSGSAQGLAWALGGLLDLGILDPARARHLDQIAGVNHMYLLFEWYQLKLDDFGKQPNQLGDSTWTLGWAMDL
jgi:hypothetical protein